jgi:hypothetical protein
MIYRYTECTCHMYGSWHLHAQHWFVCTLRYKHRYMRVKHTRTEHCLKRGDDQRWRLLWNCYVGCKVDKSVEPLVETRTDSQRLSWLFVEIISWFSKTKDPVVWHIFTTCNCFEKNQMTGHEDQVLSWES